MEQTYFDERRRAYANLIIRRGVNLQPGQRLILISPIQCASFARLVQEEAYLAGASDVMMHWGDAQSDEIKYRHASLEVLATVEPYRAAAYNDYTDVDTCWVGLLTTAPPPEGLDPEKISAAMKARMEAFKPMNDARMKNIVRWNLVGVPTEEWAGMVYPELPAEGALSALWRDVLVCTRTDEGDPLANWDRHVESSFRNRDLLNDHRFTSLHFTSGLGTDLRVGLVDGYRFLATQETGVTGHPFIANMPSEEIYSAPHRDKVDGVVVCSKPLYEQNMLIEGLRFTFKDGAVVDFSAETGEETMRRILDTDEGARRLGEVALVGFDSAVSRTGKVFFNTLYDENAACHLALGESYPETIDGGLEMEKDELLARGMNQSLEHVDFMFGTEDMRIVGTTADGGEVVVFENGTWAW